MKKMKKITTLLLVLSFVVTQAQFTLTNHETGNEIHDGDIVTVSTANITTHIIAKNVSSNDIYLSLEVQDIINTDGTEMTYCFGIGGGGGCFFRMVNGERKDGGNPLAPNAETGTNDIDFTHKDDHTDIFPNYPKDYIIKIFATDTNGGNQIGNAITFTYRFDPSQNIINNLKESGVEFFVNQKKLDIKTNNEISISIYNLTGEEVYKQKMLKGEQIIDLAKLSNGIYILNIITNNTKAYFRKILLK